MNIPDLRTPLLIPATLLSGASLAWTTWSLVDLLGAGPIGVTVAAGADIIWASVILAEARGVHVPVRGWNLVPIIGWAALVAVAALLAWHGIDRDVPAMAVGGPFLPLGTKALWLMALADMRDPSALTDADKAQLAAMERGMRFEEAEHRVELRRREMTAERLLADVSVDFEIELARQDKGRELARRAPLAIAPITPEQAPITLAVTTEQAPTPQHPTPAATSPITDREQKSIADLAREHVAIHPTNPAATDAICALRTDADRPSVGAAVRRARQQLDTSGGYR